MKKIYGDLQVMRTLRSRRSDTSVLDITDNTTLNAYSPSIIQAVISSAKDLTVPGTGLYIGWSILVHNEPGSSASLTVKVSSNTIAILKAGEWAIIEAKSATPSSATDWAVRKAIYTHATTSVVNMGGAKITNLGYPNDDGDAASKLYVDTFAQGFTFKGAARLAADTDLGGVYAYNAGDSTITTILTTLDIDNKTIVNGDRILVYGQTNPYENGIYTVSGVGSAIVFTRDVDANSWADLHAGAFIIIEEGDNYHDRGFVLSNEPNLTDWGTTSPGGDILFTQFGSWIVAGDGIAKSGDTISVRLKGVASDGTGTPDDDRTLDFVSGSLETRLATTEPGIEKFNDTNGGLRTQRDYTDVFNATTDWGTASGGYYTITVLAATHLQGTTPLAFFFEESGTDYLECGVDEIKYNVSGDVIFRVPEVPDLRFAGKYIITHKYFA